MKTTKEHIVRTWYKSESHPEIESCDSSDKEIIEWMDENPVVFEIVTKNKSKAFGKKSCVYIGWAQNNNSAGAILEKLRTLKGEAEAILEKLRTLKGEAEATRFSSLGTIFQYRAQFTLKHYKDKGFTGGFFQQWDREYQRDCLTLDYTPELLDEVIREFEGWISNFYTTKKITIDGKIVKQRE